MMQRKICRNLRTKKSYVAAFSAEDLYGDEQMNAQFFCLRTLLQIGTDDGRVAPEACGGHRACYEALSPLT